MQTQKSSKKRHMKKILKTVINAMLTFNPLRTWTQTKRQEKELIEWENNGRPSPPPHIIKQRLIRNHAETYGLTSLIETGTYYGDMVEAMKGHFYKIYSIELSKDLYRNAKKRFCRDKNVNIIHGDSGIELGKLVKGLTEPTLFWLDGHYSAGVTARGDKDTPIYEELTHIFKARLSKYVIIIDDARCFGSDPAYPSLKELSDFIRTNNPESNIEVIDDSIIVTQSEGKV